MFGDDQKSGSRRYFSGLQSQRKMPKICIIGAGVIGLSSALRVLELCPGSEVKVVAEKFSPFTTTDVSGGFWEPHLLGDTPKHLIKRWSDKTFDHMVQLAQGDTAKYTGASLVSGYRMHTDENAEEPDFKDKVFNYRVLSPKDLEQFQGMRSGCFYTTAMLEPGRYLQWLMKRFQRKGGRMEKRRVDSINKLFEEGADVVINCTGLGSSDLVRDSNMKPIRGQVIRVHADWLKSFYIFIDGHHADDYILPGASYVVLGGTAQEGSWNQEVNKDDSFKIWKGCTKYIPSLTEATVDSVHVGLRPCRHSVRLELETKHIHGKTKFVVHNYGHGGSGVTLHWGCAEDAVNLVRQALERIQPVTSKL